MTTGALHLCLVSQCTHEPKNQDITSTVCQAAYARIFRFKTVENFFCISEANTVPLLMSGRILYRPKYLKL